MTDTLLGGGGGGGGGQADLCCYFCPHHRLSQSDVLRHIKRPVL